MTRTRPLSHTVRAALVLGFALALLAPVAHGCHGDDVDNEPGFAHPVRADGDRPAPN